MTREAHALARRFAEHAAGRGGLAAGDGLVVAVSGGVDSLALLHLVRFGSAFVEVEVTVGHVDHAMRPGSSADAAWVRGLCRAWDVPFRSVRLDPPPGDEAEARRRRYQALELIRRESGARLVLTAHHADDQAETVLYRAVRGTGIDGLSGIRERREPGLWRPLLPFTRDELTAYARAVGLSWREDPSNRAPLPRNVLRHRILPELERSVAPGARRALAGLARRAQAEREAWAAVVPGLLKGAGGRTEDGGYSLEYGAFSHYASPVRARLIRTVAKRLGHTLSEAGTHLAVEFTSSGRSGGEIPLGAGLVLRRELGRLVVSRALPVEADVPVRIDGPVPGERTARLGGIRYRVRWSTDPVAPDVGWQEGFAVGDLRFPLRVRGWAAGDRARLPYGHKKLKKLFLEARVPPGRRHRMPVLVDGGDVVLWVPEVVRSADAGARTDENLLYIGITHADSD